jgi:Family of unknown function (DUF6510)
MDAVDGNAIGGLLIDVFGAEMTTASTACATCGASRPLAELVVYQRAPGTVVRCRTCGNVVMVFVRRMGRTSVDLSGLTSLSGPRTWPQPGSAGNQERINMSEEQPMSMPGEPQEESMSMGGPGEGAMSMGAPDPESTSMGEPGADAMSMGAPDPEPMSMGQPPEESQ